MKITISSHEGQPEFVSQPDHSDLLTIAYLSGAHDRKVLIRHIKQLTAERDELKLQVEKLRGDGKG